MIEITFSNVLASIAALVALASFIFTWWSTVRTLEPYLTASEYSGEGIYSYAISNKGGGPALISKVEYYAAGNSLTKDKFIEAIKLELKNFGMPVGFHTTTLGEKSIIGCHDNIELVKITYHMAESETWKGIESRLKLRLVIQYKSVHGKLKPFDSDE